MKKTGYERHKDYEPFIGDYVTIYLKNMIMTEKDSNGNDIVASAMKAFIVDVTPVSIIIGDNPNEAYGIIPLEDVGPILLAEDIPDALKFPTPPIEEQN